MALFRALESCRRPAHERLFDDPLAARFLSPPLAAVAAAARIPGAEALISRFIDARWPGARSAGIARTRWIDEALRRAVRGGVRQVLLLGAGFDARAVRLAELRDCRVFEVDHPDTQRAKQAGLARALGRLPENVVFTPLDFARQSLDAELAQAGFDAAQPSFVVWEGVTNYLTADAVDTTLRWVGARTAAGTRLVFTYVERSAIWGPGPGDPNLVATLARAGERWTFGFDPAEVPDYLTARGLTCLADQGARELRAATLGARDRDLPGYEFYHLALAEVRSSLGAGTAMPAAAARRD